MRQEKGVLLLRFIGMQFSTGMLLLFISWTMSVIAIFGTAFNTIFLVFSLFF